MFIYFAFFLFFPIMKKNMHTIANENVSLSTLNQKNMVVQRMHLMQCSYFPMESI